MHVNMCAAPTEECSQPLSTYTFEIPTADHSISHILLRGHKVVGGGYTGNLLCTGLTHWRVADLTSRYICSRSKLFLNRSVLELGCGLGLCGIVAAHSVGLKGRVLLTDGDFEVVDIASNNVKSNNVQNVARTSLLKWDDVGTAKNILNEYSNDDQDRKGFDVIIGSDCLYSGMEAVQQLFSLVAIMLAENIDNAGGKFFESNTDIANSYMNSSCQNSSDKHGNGDYDDKDDDDHLSPTSVDGGGWMLVDSGPERSMSINSYEAHSDPNYNDKKKGSGVDIQPVFILGYERRLGGANVDMYAMFEIAAGLGFEWCIAEDSVIDIFGNETSEQTLLWEQCIFLFTRKRQLRSNSEKG